MMYDALKKVITVFSIIIEATMLHSIRNNDYDMNIENNM